MSDDFCNCPYCGAYLNSSYGSAPNQCPSCNRHMPQTGVVGLDDISTAIHAQADSAASMLAALTHAHALPLTSLLQGWWDKLKGTDQDHFAEALLRRAMYLVTQGTLDDPIKEVVKRRFSAAALIKLIEKLIEKGNGEDVITVSMAKRVAEQVAKSNHEELVLDGIKDVIRQIAREKAMDAREIIEATVRDRMPDIEEMTKKIVGDIADDTAREVRARMRRKDGD